MSENGKFAWIIEKEFKEAIGEKGQKILRIVLDKEGKVVTAFPVDNIIKRLAIKGMQVSAQIAAVALLSTLYEQEAQAAEVDITARKKQLDDSKHWIETALEWIGPLGLFESSSIALAPNFDKIKTSQKAAIKEAEISLERKLTDDEAKMIRVRLFCDGKKFDHLTLVSRGRERMGLGT